MFAQTRRLASRTGASLAYHHQPAATPARGVLLVCHGLAEHSRRYQHVAEAIATQGLHVYVHDHRGHGETTAGDAPLGRFARRGGTQAVIADVMAMRALAEQQHPGLPVLLLGHSMGGLIALNAAIDHPQAFAGLSVWNSNLNPGLSGRAAQLILRAEKMLKGSDVPSAHLPKLTFGAWGRSIVGHRTEFDWLSHDQAAVDRYIADPLCGFDASVSLWLDIFALSFRGASTEMLQRLDNSLPVYLVGGSEDPATRNGREIRWLANRLNQAGLTELNTTVYPKMRHETLNEIGRDTAIADFVAWCKTVLPAAQTAPVPQTDPDPDC
jgi:alpha-beta hydrolase superfamily lysophospholipase